jgi:VWFA-related protein
MAYRRWLRFVGLTRVGAAIFAGMAQFAGQHNVQAQAASPVEKQVTPQLAVPTIKVTSRETVVDVTVTDKDGKPVHGLTQADFTVKEDRKEQPIRSFHEYGSEAVSAPEKLPPNTYSNRQPAAASGAVNILLLDFTNAAPILALDCCIPPFPQLGPPSLSRAMERQRHIKQYAMQYLHDMPAGTRIAVLGASHPSNLRVLQGVTSDPELLSSAVDSMQYDADGSVEIYPPNHMQLTLESWCSQQSVRNRMTIESLDQIAADAVAIKGRKNLLWFTTGIPTMTETDYRPPCLPDYSTELKKTYGLLAAAQVTVFPISVRGVPAEADQIGESWPEEHLSLEAVAEATGGTAYYNSNDLKESIGKAIASGSDYYTLTYIPPGTQYDGRHHTIKLEVDQPGLHLTYRDGYYAEDPSKMKPTVGLTLSTTAPDAADGNMRAAMSRSMPTSEQLLFNVRVEPSTAAAKVGDPPVMGMLDPKLNGKPLTRYSFYYDLAASQLAFVDGANGTHNGSVEFDIAAYDAEAKLVTSLGQSVKMPLSEERYKQFIAGPFHFAQQIDLPTGQLFVRIGVLDKTSNKVGTLEIPLTVAKGSGK